MNALIRRTLSAALALSMSLLLSACGDGGSASTTSTTTTRTETAPTITSQPVAVTVVAGSGASFSVSAAGSGTLSYQWRKAGSAISGATSAMLALSAVTTDAAGSYDVVVSNSVGSVTSAAAALTVTSASGVVAPTIGTQPASVAVLAGASATFSVAVSGTAPFTYQWLKDGNSIPGATASTYTVASAAVADAGSYSVRVTNSAGSANSAAALLSVTSNSSGGSALAAATTSAAQAFLASLSTAQQSSVVLTWDLATARRWSNLPASMVARNGIAWGSLSATQKAAADTLIATALGSTGRTMQIGMQAADDYLNTAGGGSTYGNANYYIAMLGTPTATGFWVLQLTGHHLTFNVAFSGAVKSSTPLFLAIEPKGAFTQAGVAYDPMQSQRVAAAELGAALTGYSGALLSGTYSDLLFGANGSGGIDGAYPKSYPSGSTGRGVQYTSLSSGDQAKVQALIRSYVNLQAAEYADDILATYLSDTALAQTYVAYAGGGNVTTSGSYIRVDGPRVWIEFSVQRGVIISSDIHYHTIWRDKTGDYGGRCCS